MRALLLEMEGIRESTSPSTWGQIAVTSEPCCGDIRIGGRWIHVRDENIGNFTTLIQISEQSVSCTYGKNTCCHIG